MSTLEIKLTTKQVEYLLKVLFEYMLESENSYKNVPRYVIEMYHDLANAKIKHEQRGKYAKELFDTIKSVSSRRL